MILCLLRKMPASAARLGLFSSVALLVAACASVRPGSFTFVQMCDPQLGFGGYEDDLARLRQAVKQINDLHPDFTVVCGDLVNGANTNSFRDFKAVMAGLRAPYYCAPGNHDVGNSPNLATLRRYRAAMGKDYFSFAHKGCTFVIADSQLWKAPVAGESEQQDAWLKTTLETAATHHRPVFVVEHYPLFEKTADEPEIYFNIPQPKRRELLDLFEAKGVVAVLAGHTHTTLTNEFHGIQMVESETTSRNFDKKPFGFRVWRVGSTRPYANEFVPLQTPAP